MTRAFIGWTLLALVSLPACNSCNAGGAAKDEVKPADLQLSNVKAACEHKAKWPKRLHATCTKCLSLASAPACGCATDERAYSGLCAQEQHAKISETACEDVSQCAFKCKPLDCECVAKCYETEAKCHEQALALESCLANTCDPYCR